MKSVNYIYQKNFSQHHKKLYRNQEREQKAKKIIAVLKDYFQQDLSYFKNLNLLDIGSSTGIMTHLLSKYFADTIGIDIDEEAVKFSKEKFENKNLHFYLQDAMKMDLTDNSNIKYVYLFILKIAYWLCPTYIWILKKIKS